VRRYRPQLINGRYDAVPYDDGVPVPCIKQKEFIDGLRVDAKCPLCGRAVKKFESIYYWGYSWDCNCLLDQDIRQAEKYRESDDERMIEKIKAVHGSYLDEIPERHKKYLFAPNMSRVSPEIKNIPEKWETEYKEKNFYIWGASGLGKSFDLAWLTTQLQWRPADEIIWTTSKKLTNEIINKINNLDYFIYGKIMILEDLQNCQGGELGMILEVLDGRENLEGRRTWATGSLSPVGIENKLQNSSFFTRLFQRAEPGDRGRFLEIAKTGVLK